jgi:hypothetical protein
MSKTWLIRNQTTVDKLRAREMPAYRLSYDSPPPNPSVTLRRAMDVLVPLLRRRPGMSLAEIVAETGWSRSAVEEYTKQARLPFIRDLTTSGRGMLYRYFAYGEAPTDA